MSIVVDVGAKFDSLYIERAKNGWKVLIETKRSTDNYEYRRDEYVFLKLSDVKEFLQEQAMPFLKSLEDSNV